MENNSPPRRWQLKFRTIGTLALTLAMVSLSIASLTMLSCISKGERASGEIAKQTAEKFDDARETFAKGEVWNQHPLVDKSYKHGQPSGSSSLADHLRKGEQASGDIAKKTAEQWGDAREAWVNGGAWHQHPPLDKTYKHESSTVVNHLRKGEQASGDIAKQTAKKWDNASETFAKGGAWHQHPLVVKTFKHRQASGSSSLVDHLRKNYGARSKCLSIGCGDGGIELEMVQAGLCETMEGIDLSSVRVEKANQIVPAELREKVHFSVKNAEKDLDGQAYDLVFFANALHHIFDLEAMSATIRDCIMEPTNGILVLEEYVGAVRFQLPQAHLDAMADLLKSLEAKYPDRVESIRQNPLWDGNVFHRPDPEAIEKDDPSETVRSGEIVPVLSQYFTLVENVPLGGTFFQWIFHDVYNSLTDETGQHIVQTMPDAEMQSIADGKVTSDYVFQVWGNKGQKENSGS